MIAPTPTSTPVPVPEVSPVSAPPGAGYGSQDGFQRGVPVEIAMVIASLGTGLLALGWGYRRLGVKR